MGKAKRDRVLPENEAKAVTKNLRVSPQKLNLLAQMIRGKKVDTALAELEFSRKRIAQDVKKCLMSAVANAENNHSLDVNDLVVKEAYVGTGREEGVVRVVERLPGPHVARSREAPYDLARRRDDQQSVVVAIGDQDVTGDRPRRNRWKAEQLRRRRRGSGRRAVQSRRGPSRARLRGRASRRLREPAGSQAGSQAGGQGRPNRRDDDGQRPSRPSGGRRATRRSPALFRRRAPSRGGATAGVRR